MNKKIEAIEFLKGYAILSIVFYHLFQSLTVSPLFGIMIAFGGTGIHTFIFVSGFGLYLSHLKQPLPFTGFLKKRLTKVYIPYIIVVSVSALIALFIPLYDSSWYAFFGHVLLYKMFDESITGSYGLPLWFISTIIQFYLLFLPLAWLKERMRDSTFLFAGLFVSMAWGVLLILLHKQFLRTWSSSFLQFLWEFMLGMVCARKFSRDNYKFWEMNKRYLLLLAMVGLGLYSLIALEFGQLGRVFNDIPALLGYTSLAILFYKLRLPGINSFLLFTAKISYPLYLVHFLMLELILYYTSYNVGMLLVTVILSYGAALLLEKVFTPLTDQLLAKTSIGN